MKQEEERPPFHQSALVVIEQEPDPMANKVAEAIASNEGTAFYRIILAGVLAALAWYFAQSDASTKQQIQELQEETQATRDLVRETAADNRLQDTLIDMLTRQILDHETRMRTVETWRTYVNNRLEEYPPGVP